MELTYMGKGKLGDLEYDKLSLKIGDSSIKGIQFEGHEPLFSASDYLKLIGVKPAGSYYTHLINNSSERYTFADRKLGTYVSIDGMIKYSAKDRRGGENPFLNEVINSFKHDIDINLWKH